MAFAPQVINAQNQVTPNVIVTTSPDTAGSLTFDADVTGEGTFTIELIFNKVTNGTAPERVICHVDGSGSFYRILSNNVPEQVKVDFAYNWLQGELNPPAQYDFVYRLPFEAGVTGEMTLLSAQQMGYFHGNFSNFRAMRFDLPQDTPLYAMRAGLVVYATNDPQDNNAIVVQHFDGTMAEYNNIASITVKTGDRVTPETRIGNAGQFFTGDYGVRVGVYRYISNNNDRHRGMAQTDYLNPVFITAKGNMTLKNGEQATAKITKKIVKKESKLRKRVFFNM